MKNQKSITKAVALLLAGSMLCTSCTSTTMIQSNPIGAKVYINGEQVGTTPYTYQDTKIVGSKTNVKLEKEGFETMNTFFSRDEVVDAGAIVGGIFLLVPFLWTMKYKPLHTYTLVPLNGNNTVPEKPVSNPSSNPPQKNAKSKADKLRELKQLLDDKILTQEEYEKEKKKILEAEDK
jgi:PEGA domain/Short C-terminal domain